jgi:hypothetical protein
VLGIFPTIAALMTLSALFFLMFLIIRTLSSRTPKRPPRNHEKNKKKKKKGGDNKSRSSRRGDNQRVQNGSVPYRIQRTGSQKGNDQAVEDERVLSKRGGTNTLLTPLPELSTTPCTLNPAPRSLDPLVQSPASTPPPAPQSTAANLEEDVVAVTGTTDKRSRVSSASTQDTTPLLDDISCGSTSVRSFPSVSVGSGRSRERTKAGNKSTPSRKGGKRNGARTSINQDSNGSGKKVGQIESTAPSSRWDALKPDSNVTVASLQHTNYHGQKAQHYSPHDKHYKSGHPRSNNRHTGNGVNRKGNHPHKSALDSTTLSTSDSFPTRSSRPATVTPPRPRSGAMNAKNQDVDMLVDGSAMQVGAEQRDLSQQMTSQSQQMTSQPPPGFQDYSSYSNDQPASTFEGTLTSTNSVVLPWLQRDSDGAASNQGPMSLSMFESIPQSTVVPTPARDSDWNDAAQLFPSPSSSSSVMVATCSSQNGPRQSQPVASERFVTTLKENPFDDTERLIEDELQELEELGGQMAGSILDF